MNTHMNKAISKKLLTYLSGTILFVGLKNVEQMGLDLWESQSDTVRDNNDKPVKHLNDTKREINFCTCLQNLHT